VVFLDATVVNIAFPALSADFPSVNRTGLSWVLNGLFNIKRGEGVDDTTFSLT